MPALLAVFAGFLPAWALADSDQGIETHYQVVRVDLRAGLFLDPVPFGEPFLIAGRVPGSTRSVGVTVQEYQSLSPVCGAAGQALYAIAARSFLDSVLVEGMAPLSRSQSRWLRQSLAHIVASSCSGRHPGAPGGAARLLPWNWVRRPGAGNLVAEVLAPGTLFDLDGYRGSQRTTFEALANDVASAPAGAARDRALDMLVDAVARASRGARIGHVAGTQAPMAIHGWARLEGSARVRGTEPVSIEPSLSVRWNRLDPGAARSSGRRDDQEEFHVLVPPLRANGIFSFRFAFERDLDRIEVDALASHLRQRLGDGSAIEAGLSPAASRRLLLDLTRSAEVLTGGALMVAPSGTPDMSVSVDLAAVQLVGVLEPAMAAPAAAATIDTVVERVAASMRNGTVAGAVTVVANTQTSNHVSMDIGLIHAPEIDETRPYIGASLYLAPMSTSHMRRRGEGLRSRLALTMGLTLQSIRDGRRTRDDLFSSQAFLIGAGMRVTQSLRVGGGALILRERDPDSFPLTGRKRLALTPYASVSFGVNVGKQLGALGRLVGPVDRRESP